MSDDEQKTTSHKDSANPVGDLCDECGSLPCLCGYRSIRCWCAHCDEALIRPGVLVLVGAVEEYYCSRECAQSGLDHWNYDHRGNDE